MKSPKVIARLVEAAVSAQKHAYCPYSRFAVGASVLTESGRIFAGCNVENASYGLTICAERAAIFNAISRNQRGMKAICIAGRSPKPCGACRQVMFEFSTKETALYLVDLNSNPRRQTVKRTSVHAMLPSAFDPLASGLLAANPQNLLRNRAGAAAKRRRRRPSPSKKSKRARGRRK